MPISFVASEILKFFNENWLDCIILTFLLLDDQSRKHATQNSVNKSTYFSESTSATELRRKLQYKRQDKFFIF